MTPNTSPLTLLTPPQWELLKSILPNSPSGRDRPALDNLLILEAILYKLASGLPWYDLPARYPSHQTVYRRYRLWLRMGLFDEFFRLLYLDLRHRGGLDLQTAIGDGRIHIQSAGRPFRLTFHPSISPWQKITVSTLLALLMLRHKRASASHNPLIPHASPAQNRVK